MKALSGSPIRVLVVEDDPAQKALLSSWLKTDGYYVEAFTNGLTAQQYLGSQWADLMILDWDVPGVSGEKLLQWVRRRSQATMPVIFQTVHAAESDVVHILDAGADDYLVKPLDRQVLLARVRALLRRFGSTNAHSRRMLIDDCVLDHRARALVRAEVRHELGTKEFDILWHLASHQGAVVLRQDLMSVVWGVDAAVQSRSVDMYVSRLRAGLKAIGVGWSVQSVYATGYRLTLPASEDADEQWHAGPGLNAPQPESLKAASDSPSSSSV